jgi:hypothetical protein
MTSKTSRASLAYLPTRGVRRWPPGVLDRGGHSVVFYDHADRNCCAFSVRRRILPVANTGSEGWFLNLFKIRLFQEAHAVDRFHIFPRTPSTVQHTRPMISSGLSLLAVLQFLLWTQVLFSGQFVSNLQFEQHDLGCPLYQYLPSAE